MRKSRRGRDLTIYRLGQALSNRSTLNDAAITRLDVHAGISGGLRFACHRRTLFVFVFDKFESKGVAMRELFLKAGGLS